MKKEALAGFKFFAFSILDCVSGIKNCGRITYMSDLGQI